MAAARALAVVGPRALRLTLGLALVAAVGVPALAAQDAGVSDARPVGPIDRFAGWEQMVDGQWRFDPDDRPLFGFSVPSSVEARTAYDDIATAVEEGDLSRAGKAIIDVLSRRPNHVVQVEGDFGRWVGSGEWAAYRLDRALSDAALREVVPEEWVRNVEAATVWRDAERLLDLSRRWDGLPLAAVAGDRAARLLAERGEHAAARRAALRAAASTRDQGQAERLLALIDSLPGPESARSPPDLRLPDSLVPDWAERLTMTRLVNWMAQPTRGSRWMARHADIVDHPYNTFDREPESFDAPVAPIVPTVSDGVVFVSDGLSVTALDLYSGRELWHHAGPMEDATYNRDVPPRFDLGTYARNKRKRAISPYIYAAPTVVGDTVLATVQVSEPSHELRVFDTIPINWPLPRRRIVALDRSTGDLRWQQGVESDDDTATFANRFDIGGQVLAREGLVYAVGSVTEGAINAYMAAFDLETGVLQWRTLLCSGQQDLTMFNRPFQEHVVSPPLLVGDDLYACTNLGLVVCVDAWTGRVRWLTGYEPTKRRASRSPHRQNPRAVNWTNHAPVLEGGRLFVTPLDSEVVLVLDPVTGRIQDDSILSWDQRVRGDYRHDLVGVGDGTVVISGPQSLERIDAASLGLVWRNPVAIDRLNRVIGPVTVADTRLLIPLYDELLVLDVADGTELQRLEWRSSLVRRVVAAERVLVMTDNLSVFAALDVQQEMDRATEQGGNGIAARLELAELLLSGGRHDEARRRFQEVLDGGDAVLAERARSGRLEAMRRLAWQRDDVEGWVGLLAIADRADERLSVAAEALPALHGLGAHAQVDEWLARLAAEQPQAVLDLGPVWPDGAAPLRLVASLRRLATDSPTEAVARLQGHILSDPTTLWQGRTLREEASTRLTELIEAHGREVYAAFDDMAAEELARAEDAGALARIEARFPNAEVVAEARRLRLQRWLDDGRARDVLLELAATPGGEQHRELRAAAAASLGDRRFANALVGTTTRDTVPELPRLPRDDAALTVLYVDKRDRVSFPPVRGAVAPDLADKALVAINGRGMLDFIDARAGELVWDRSLPGGITYARPTDVDLMASGDRLLARGGSELVSLDLRKGGEHWNTFLRGVHRDVLHADGLVLALTAYGDQLRLTGYGEMSGTRSLDLEVSGARDGELLWAGGHVVLSVTGEAGTRLMVLDVVAGRFRRVIEFPEGGLRPALKWVDSLPVVVLVGADTEGARLSGWDIERGIQLWEHRSETRYDGRLRVSRPEPGRLLLAEPRLRDDALQLVPIDLASGPEQPLVLGSSLELVASVSTTFEPNMVFTDRDTPGELHVIEPGSNGTPRRLILDPPPSGGGLQVLQARDGFVLVAEALDPRSDVEVWVVRGDNDPQRYSIDVQMLNVNGRSEILLVDGALLVARGGSVAVLSRPVGTGADQEPADAVLPTDPADEDGGR